MFKLIFCVLAASIAVFSNAQAIQKYIEILYNDDSQLTDDELNSHSETHEYRDNDFSSMSICCNDEGQTDALIELKNHCFDNIRGNTCVDPSDCDGIKEIKEKMICASECIAEEYKVFDENGDLLCEPSLEVIREKTDDVQWTHASLGMFVDKCLVEANKRNKSILPAGNCNAVLVQYCIWREPVNGCPTELRDNSRNCNEIRENLNAEYTFFLSEHLIRYNLAAKHMQ